MKKRMKRTLINILIILIIFTIAYFLIRRPFSGVDRQTASCIGKNSVLYIQYGCHACEKQENLFGENYKYLNIIDCWNESEKCANITATPTWVINNKTILGVQPVDKLEELTGC